MGEYNPDWFSFEVKGKRHIMDLTIEPSFAKAVCFQVHSTEVDSYQLFWNFSFVGREISALLVEYAKRNEIDIGTAFAEILDSTNFNAFMRRHEPPIFVADLDADDMTLVDAVINANWRDEKYRCGLDGHHYDIKIYGAQVRTFECWCTIPEQWRELIPLVERLIEIAKLEPRDCYEVQGVYGADGISRRLKPLPPTNTGGMFLEIPEWLKRP